MKIDTLAILGIGFLGGSLARAVRQRAIAPRIIGVEPDEVSAQQSLSTGLIDELAPGPSANSITSADLVVCCAPVDHITELLLVTAQHARPGQLLTDVGSTKSAIVSQLEAKLPPHVLFVGSHPLAGSEKQGPEHADANLFEGRLVVVTPTERTPPAALELISAFWQAVGARVRQMKPTEHDRAVALTSHLPHLIASALAGILPPALTDLTASGFRDTTRLAASDPELWTAIALQNREFLLEALTAFDARVSDFRHTLDQKDTAQLLELFQRGKSVRDQLRGGN